MPDDSVDLIYLDLPFNSEGDVQRLVRGAWAKAAAQVRAFTDTWEWNTMAEAACHCHATC